jgi:hypothetical protein
MTMQFSDFASAVAASGTISAEDVLELRRIVWPDGVVSQDEAQAIVQINAGIQTDCPEWNAFFVEALSVWLVDEQEPRGYIDDKQAQWLIDQFAREGRPATAAEIDLLTHVLEKAVSAPLALEAFVLAQIEAAIIARAAPAGIAAKDVDQLRRIIFAPGSDHTDGVSQAEAEMLFRLKDAMLDRDNVPEWQRLFVQGVGNFLQGFSPAAPLDRAREAELEAFMAERETGVAFLKRMVRMKPQTYWQILKAASSGKDEDEHLFADEAVQAEIASHITPAHEGWLNDAIAHDGREDDYEKALREFLGKA